MSLPNVSTTLPTKIRFSLETDVERLAQIIGRLRLERKKIIIFIERDGSMKIERRENEGSFPPLVTP